MIQRLTRELDKVHGHTETDRQTYTETHSKDTHQSRCRGTAWQPGLPRALHTDRQTHTWTYTETYTDTQAEIHSKVGA